MNIMIDNSCVVKTNHDDSLIIINGIKLPPPPTGCYSVTTINGKVYIDGYEYKNGKWKKTLRAWWHLWF
jgi:hypothetical protein